MAVTEKEITLRLPPRPYQRLQELAQQTGKTPELLTQEIVERALQEPTPLISTSPRSARQILQAAGRVRPLSPALQRRIILGITLEEVQASLARAGGQPLSEIILQQRDSNS